MNSEKIPEYPCCSMTWLQICCMAIAHSGALGEGFQMTGSPAMAARNAFHAHTATGKLNAVMTPTGTERMPLLAHAMRRPLGLHGRAIEHA